MARGWLRGLSVVKIGSKRRSWLDRTFRSAGINCLRLARTNSTGPTWKVLAVETLEGVPLGKVHHLFATAGNDVLAVRGERERLIPFLWGDVVTEVDLERKLMRVAWDPDFSRGPAACALMSLASSRPCSGPWRMRGS